MIKGYRNRNTRKIAEGELPKSMGGLDLARAQARLLVLDTIQSLAELPKGYGLHKLSGDRAGQLAIRLHGPWRITFTWDGSDVDQVEIVDYH